MKYISTRGGGAADFEEVLLSGLAPDGGLYVPKKFPSLKRATIRNFENLSYQQIAHRCFQPFIGEMLDDAALRNLIDAAYGCFRHPAIVPLRQLGDHLWMAELWHGPSFAFKDLAMRILAGLLDEVLGRKKTRITILCATSGDTGASAMAAFLHARQADVFVLYPEGRISSVQRKQMTTHQAPHLHALAVKGDFDDCQAIVKGLFSDRDFCARAHLASVNSINWVRVMAQMVYYFSLCAQLGARQDRRINFVVPTGNFGDIYAGFIAKKMGAAIGRLVIANNQNDILTRALETGLYEPKAVMPSLSPSMDIQLPSNFERLLFEVLGRRAGDLTCLLENLREQGKITLPPAALKRIKKDFSAAMADDEETLATLKRHYHHSGEMIDPHSAVGLAVAWKIALPAAPSVILSTAHAAKFPDALIAATGSAPPPLAVAGEERFETIENDPTAVARFIRSHAQIFN